MEHIKSYSHTDTHTWINFESKCSFFYYLGAIERWLTGEEHWALFQQTWVWFSTHNHPWLQLQDMKHPLPAFGGPSTHVAHRYTCMQNTCKIIFKWTAFEFLKSWPSEGGTLRRIPGCVGRRSVRERWCDCGQNASPVGRNPVKNKQKLYLFMWL